MVNGMYLTEIRCPTSLINYETCIVGQQVKPVFPNDRGRPPNRPLVIAYLEVFGRMWDVLLIDDSTSSGSDLEMHSSKRIKAPMVVGVAKSSK